MGWSVPVAPVAYTPQIATDTTPRTVTGTGFTQISGDFTIPANDPNVGSVYILTCWGSALYSPTGGVPELRAVIFGVNLPVVVIVDPVGGSDNPNFLLTVYLIVTATGVSGKVNGVISLTGVDTAGSATVGGFTLIGSTTVNTTAASVFGIQGHFTSTTGAPTMTVNATIYERDGPGAVAQ